MTSCRWLAPLACIVTLGGCYIQCGGGKSDHSVTVEGDDGLVIEAEAESGGSRARIEFERKTRKSKRGFEVTYIFPKTTITQELRLIVGDGGEHSSFVIAKHDEASSFDQHGLEVERGGKRLAYRLDDRPWEVVYLLSAELAVHAPKDAGDALDWTSVPPFLDVAADAYHAHSRFDGRVTMHKQVPILEWVGKAHGDEALGDVFFRILDHSTTILTWRKRAAAMLNRRAKAQLDRRLREAVQNGDSDNERHYREAVLRSALDPNEHPAMVGKGLSLFDNDVTLLNSAEAYASLLEALSQHDADAAKQHACRLKDKAEGEKPRYALKPGRPLRKVALRLCP
jgi:hypothetical protein